jgi:hypothetical protein
MPGKPREKRSVPPAARVFSHLQADDALLPGETSALRRSGALVLALMVLAAVPLYLAANAAGLIGDAPTALAKGSNSGPGGGSGDDDDNSGPGSGGDDDDDNSGRHHTRLGTDDTSANGHSTRGTTNDNDTHTRDQTHTRTRGHTQTQTRTGS